LSQNPYFYCHRIVFDPGIVDHGNLEYVGYGRSVPSHPGNTSRPSDYSKFSLQFPKLDEYIFPVQNVVEEKRLVESLFNGVPPEEEFDVMLLANEAIDLVQCTMFNSGSFLQEHRLPSFNEFLSCVSDLKNNKFPGYPCGVEYLNKFGLATEHPVYLYEAVLIRLINLRYLAHLSPDAIFDYELFLVDPSLVSIKKEVIGVSKEPRIIFANDIVTEMVERLAYTKLFEINKHFWGINGMALGIGFGIEDSNRLCCCSRSPSMTSDSPKFDSSVKFTEELRVNRMFSNLMRVGPTVEFVLLNFRIVKSRRLIIFSDGKVYRAKVKGFTRSGLFETSQTNTNVRRNRALTVDLFLVSFANHDPEKVWVIAAGDDANEDPHPLKELVYQGFMYPLRDVEVGNQLNFCSHTWTKGQKPVGKRIFKSFSKLIYFELVGVEELNSFVQEYLHNEHFSELSRSLLLHRPEVNNIMLFSVFDDVEHDLRLSDVLSRLSVPSGSFSSPSTVFTQGEFLSQDIVSLPFARKRTKKKNSPLTLQALESRLLSKTPKRPKNQKKRVATVPYSVFGKTSGNQKNAAAAAYSKGQKTAEPVYKTMTARGCRIVHRELVSSITGSSSFSVAFTYNLNPGLSTTFPWLSVEAQGWEQYVFRKLRFCYYTRCATSTPGSIMLVPDYNASDSSPLSEQIASSYRDVVEEVPWTVEFCCELDPRAMLEPGNRKFVRTGSLAANLDVKTYDSGILFVCTTDGTAVNWGKLWVEYDVEFFVPQLPPLGVASQTGGLIVGVSPSTSSFFGTAPTITGGILLTATVDTITFNQTGQYLCVFAYEGTTLTDFSTSGTAAITNPAFHYVYTSSNIINFFVVNVTVVGQTLILADGGSGSITYFKSYITSYALANGT
jgi:hypothetical protein